jgi:hypothetical protein
MASEFEKNLDSLNKTVNSAGKNGCGCVAVCLAIFFLYLVAQIVF